MMLAIYGWLPVFPFPSKFGFVFVGMCQDHATVTKRMQFSTQYERGDRPLGFLGRYVCAG